MNYRPFVHPHDLHLMMRARHGSLLLLILLLCMLLAACGGDEEPTPTTTFIPAAEAPVSALPTAEAATSAAVASTATPVAATPAGIATLVSTPAATNSVATGAATTTTTQSGASTPVFTPLEAEDGGDCEIESSLDLVGYPNLEQRMGCATEPAVFDPIAINEFGDAEPTDRFMLWFSQEKTIYVLLPDGTYHTYEDTWVEGTDPTYPCNPLGGEEDSPPLPRRGFGKLWCSDPELQAVLGTVPREERLCQYAVLQRFQSGRLLACFEDATVRYFRILDDGTWDLQMQ
ncbi:MAG: hypothetical protein IT328_11685 [Caldilineaceae bacterium]|nr:hypothetical protein [Caldilineaceae bacterium]